MSKTPIHTIAVEKQEDLIAKTIAYVKVELKDAESGHDWLHISRVYNNALAINAEEKGDNLLVSLSALLHDIADSKFHNGDETIAPAKIRAWFVKYNEDEGSTVVSDPLIEEILLIVNNMSYHSSMEGNVGYNSLELQIVQDADRLDALGAIGVARCLTYGGYKNRPIYDPAIEPKLNMTKEEYKNHKGPSLNHFHEKLFKLKDLINTTKGKAIAESRTKYMVEFLQQFYGEVAGTR